MRSLVLRHQIFKATMASCWMLGTFALISIAAFVNSHKLVAYWGQNGIYQWNKEPKFFELGLMHLCKNSKYDTIALAFINVFFDPRNKDRMPGLNFAGHCFSSSKANYPTLLRCPKIEQAIEVCHKNGKKVVASLGGEIGDYGFKSDSEAKLFAYRIWNLFLQGKEMEDLRPFGKAVLDGIDLQVIKYGHKGYSTFIRQLRALEKKSGSSPITISAAPQCDYPDRHLGPGKGTALGDLPQAIDSIYVQFRSVLCCTKVAQENMLAKIREWLKYSEREDGGMIYVGLAAHIGAAGDERCYRTPKEVEKLYLKLRDEPRFGGIMLWDVGFDENNRINNLKYSDHIHRIIKGKVHDDRKNTTSTLPLPLNVGCEDTNQTCSSPENLSHEDCNDKSEACHGRESLCQNQDIFGDFMRLMCKKTCNICQQTASPVKSLCRDYKPFCVVWKRLGMCQEQCNFYLIRLACRRTCGICTM